MHLGAVDKLTFSNDVLLSRKSLKIYLRLLFNVSFATQLIISDVYPNVWKLFHFKVSTSYTLFISAEGGALREFESPPFSKE